MSRQIGILAAQGDFELHYRMIDLLGEKAVLVKTEKELHSCEALILPGGESTTISKILKEDSLFGKVKEFARNKPIMGTCAGMILLSKKIEDSALVPLGLINITVRRNAYGRQIESFVDEGQVKGIEGNGHFEMVFIRAPKITGYDSDVQVLGYCRSEVVMVRNQNILALSFHPELTSDNRIHKYFLKEFVKK